MKKTMLVMAMAIAMVLSTTAMAFANNGNGKGGGTASEAGKVNLCHFEGHVAPTNASGDYLDDRNGDSPGFWTVTGNSAFNPTSSDIYLVGDYIVRYDEKNGDEFGLNNGQKALCTGNGGEFIQVSVNSLGGHNAQLVFDVVLDTYPTGWWK